MLHSHDEFCIAVTLYPGSMHHFLKTKLLKGIAFRSSPGSSACVTQSRKKGLVTMCLFLGPVVSSFNNYCNLNL